jgi:NADH-ubiquinone oxidoreductase chain 2
VDYAYSIFVFIKYTPSYLGGADLFFCMMNLIAMIQLIQQLKGYFQLNPILALSLAITIFSFMGIPPLIGFFAKQLVLSAALQGGFYFLALVGILTSVIGAVYYLAILKAVFFDQPDYKPSPQGNSFYDPHHGVSGVSVLSSSLTTPISVLTLMILLFIIYPEL